MQNNFNQEDYQKKKKHKKYAFFMFLFIFGAYASIQSVISFGQENDQKDLVMVDNSVKTIPNDLQQAVLGSKEYGPAWQESENKENNYTLLNNNTALKPVVKKSDYDVSGENLAFQPTTTTEKTENDDNTLAISDEQAIDPCQDAVLAASLDLAQCFTGDVDTLSLGNQVNAQNAYSSGGGGTSSVDNTNNQVEEENQSPAVTLGHDATLASWIVGGTEVIGLPGSEPMSKDWVGFYAGVPLSVGEIESFIGTQVIPTDSNVSKLVLSVYRGYWTSYDLLYPGTVEFLNNFAFQNDDVVTVSVTSEDGEVNNWYKAKIYEAAPEVTLDYLQSFQIFNHEAVGLPGLHMDYANMNIVDFGANVIFNNFDNAHGIKISFNNSEKLTETKLYTRDGAAWLTWDLAIAETNDLIANLAVHQGDVMLLKLVDINDQTYWYKVNLLLGEEAQRDTELNSDNTLQYLTVGGLNVLNLSGIEADSATSTGAILEVADFEEFKGVDPQANDRSHASVKVMIYRDGVWTTYQYEVGLDIVRGENILPNDVILIEVTAEDGSKKLYKVTITYQAIIYSADNSLNTLVIDNQDFAKTAGLYAGSKLDLTAAGVTVDLTDRLYLDAVKATVNDPKATISYYVYQADELVYDSANDLFADQAYQFDDQDSLFVKVTAENGDAAFYRLNLNLIPAVIHGGGSSVVAPVSAPKEVEIIKEKPLNLEEVKTVEELEVKEEIKATEITEVVNTEVIAEDLVQ